MTKEAMRVVEIKEFGGPEGLTLTQRDVPEIQSHEILIEIYAAGVNGPDLLQRRGHYPAPKGASDLLGLEVSGVVAAVGENVTDWKIGDPVCALTHGGGYAEYVAVNATHCLAVPDGVDMADAAGLPETFFTVWSNLFFGRSIPAGKRLLVHGGSGGIGSTAIQLGAAFDLDVFTTCGNDEKVAYCNSLGAKRAINYRNEAFVDLLREAGGADFIIDIVGGDYIAQNIKASAPDATIIQLAFNQGSKVEIDLMPIMLKRLTFTGSTLRSRPDAFKAAIAADLRDKVWPLFASGKLKTQTHTTLPLAEAAKAHEMMEAASHMGKILLLMK